MKFFPSCTCRNWRRIWPWDILDVLLLLIEKKLSFNSANRRRKRPILFPGTLHFAFLLYSLLFFLIFNLNYTLLTCTKYRFSLSDLLTFYTERIEPRWVSSQYDLLFQKRKKEDKWFLLMSTQSVRHGFMFWGLSQCPKWRKEVKHLTLLLIHNLSC